MNGHPPRVVVSGLGLVTSVGTGKTTFWNSVLEGRSGISPVGMFDTSRYKVHHGGEVRGFDPADWFSRLDPETVGRASQLAVAAARLALDDSQLQAWSHDSVGVYVGTTSGEPGAIEQFDDRRLAGQRSDSGRPLLDRYPCHLIAANVAREFQFGGDALVVPAACAAGNYALAHAFDAIQSGELEIVLAGGSDCFSRITYTGFHRLGAIASECCQPFDLNRTGMIPGEGAAMLVVESLEHAIRRGATIYAEIAGYGLSCDAHHMTAAHPEGRGASAAMTVALTSAGISPDEISYVSAHGTGTKTNDRLESLACRNVFRDSAPPISSIKSMLGHTMGAASAIEAVVCAMAINTNHIPPTMNLNDPDPECGPLDFVANESRAIDVNVAMSNAYAFGGTNSSLILRKCVV